MLAELELDKIHLARYSPRPGTVSARRLEDDVPEEEKRRRFQLIEALNLEISRRKMGAWLGQTVEVLVESRDKGRWRGRTPQNKLVFFDDPRALKGELVLVRITHAGPWSMSGEPEERIALRHGREIKADSIPLALI